MADFAQLLADIKARQDRIRASLIEMEPSSWDAHWTHAIGSPDSCGYYDYMVREYLFPILKNYGFAQPVKLAGLMVHAGPFPEWFKVAVFNVTRGVLSTRRVYTLDAMLRLIEGLYGLPRGVIRRV